MADEAPEEAPSAEEAPAPAPAAEAGAPESEAAAPSAEDAAPPAEAAAPPAEPAHEPAKEPEAAAPPPEPPARVPEAGEPVPPRTSSVSEPKPSVSISFDKPPQSDLSNLDGRKSSLFPKSSRLTKEMASRRSTKKDKNFSLMSIKRGSFASFQERSKAPKYMNSYKLNSENPFNVDKVNGILATILKESIDDSMVYDPESCPNKSKSVSSLIRAKVKEQDYDRYKLVCVVTIGEKKSQDVFTGVRFLWDSEKDRYATCKHENMYVFITACVFALYYE